MSSKLTEFYKPVTWGLSNLLFSVLFALQVGATAYTGAVSVLAVSPHTCYFVAYDT